MFALRTANGSYATSVRTDERFTYSTRELARRAARILSHKHNVQYQVVET